MTLLDRQREYTSWLVAGFPEYGLEGLPLKGACAFTGNGSQENLVKPVTTGPKDHGSDGILQWRLGRLDGPKGLKGWSQARGIPWDTIRTQAAFTLWELHQDYPALERDLREDKKSIETLTANICWDYERPAKQYAELDKRISHAKSVYMIMSKDQKVSGAVKTGGVATGGGLIVAGGTNIAQGGDNLMSAISIAAGLIATAAPWIFEKFKKAPAPVLPPVHEPEDDAPVIAPLEITASETAAYDGAKAHRLALEAELALAVEAEEVERLKVVARAEALLATIGAKPPHTNAPAIPAPQKPPVDSGEYQGA